MIPLPQIRGLITLTCFTRSESRSAPAIRQYTGYMLKGDTIEAFDYTDQPANADNNVYVFTDTHTAATGYFGFWQDGTEVFSEDNLAFLNNTFGNATNMHHWSNSYGSMYALRYYTGILTDEEAAQNHFADLAKFFRLDLSVYYNMSADERAVFHAALVNVPLDASRDEVVAACAAATEEYYKALALSSDAELNAAFNALAYATQLDVKRLALLGDGQADAFMQALTAEFDPAYSISVTVVTALYTDATDFVKTNLFGGTSVRIDNGANTDAGIRGTFTVDEALLAELIAEYGTITFGTEIVVDGAVKSTLSFVATAKDGAISYSGGEIVANGDGTATYIYTMVYGEDDMTDEILNGEFSYRRFIKLGDATYTVDVVCSVFGDTFSAAEVYGYFAANGYAEDAVVNSVLAALANN